MRSEDRIRGFFLSPPELRAEGWSGGGSTHGWSVQTHRRRPEWSSGPSIQRLHRVVSAEILPRPAKAVVAVAAFAGLRKGELRSLRLEDYDGSSLKISRSAWRKHVNQPKGKRGTGTVPLIPTAASVLDEHLASVKSKAYMFATLRDDPADLDYLVREVIRPKFADAGLPWYGLHAFRRGLATNLHDLGVADIVIQTILRHSDVSVTRLAYIKNDAVDPRSLAAMQALETAVCNERATAPDTEKDQGAVN